MNYILFDDAEIRTRLLPLTYSRPVAQIRIGILTIAEKWQRYLSNSPKFLTASYLSLKYTTVQEANEDYLYINGAVCPSLPLFEKIVHLKTGEYVESEGVVIAYNKEKKILSEITFPIRIIKNVWDIFVYNAKEIISDFALITRGRQSEAINDAPTIVYAPDNIFIEKGAKIRAAILNGEDGPIYIGKDSIVQEGSIIKGPFALCEGSHINMGAKMRGDTTIGPFSKVGGEINNSVIFGFSNKAHDGFLGNSILGEWCNLGADTNTSNLKNNYAEVDIYSYRTNVLEKTGRQFFGLIMGDHSKAGINTMFNTGTVVGFNANIYGSGFPPKFVPSFSWGGADGFETFLLEKSFEIAERVMSRRNIPFDEGEKNIFSEIFKLRHQLEKPL